MRVRAQRLRPPLRNHLFARNHRNYLGMKSRKSNEKRGQVLCQLSGGFVARSRDFEVVKLVLRDKSDQMDPTREKRQNLFSGQSFLKTTSHRLGVRHRRASRRRPKSLRKCSLKSDVLQFRLQFLQMI